MCVRSRCWAPSRLISVDEMVRFHRLRPDRISVAPFARPFASSQHAIRNSSFGRASDYASECGGFKPRFQNPRARRSRPCKSSSRASPGPSNTQSSRVRIPSRRLPARSLVVKALPVKEQSIADDSTRARDHFLAGQLAFPKRARTAARYRAANRLPLPARRRRQRSSRFHLLDAVPRVRRWPSR